MTKKPILTVLVLILTSCLVLSVGLIIGAVLLLKPASSTITTATNTVEEVVVPTFTSIPTQASGSTESTPQTGTTGEAVPASIAKQMDEIQQEVMDYRGLKLKGSFQRDLLSEDQLKQNVINDFFKDYTDEDARHDSGILGAFGLLQPNFDLHQFYIDLYSEQVAGYYDNETKAMYVVSGENFSGVERMTYAHEFTHTLQDQNFDIQNGLKVNNDNCKKDTEYCAAVTALMEGDATLSEQYWYMRYSTKQDKQQVNQFYQTYTSPVYDSAPAYMKLDFLFPYQQGLDFVNELFSKGKWNAVDAAYKDPPVSTEQILHPEKYPDDKPIPVDMPDLQPVLGSGWEEWDRNVMGEWYSYLVLYAGYQTSFQLDETTAANAAAGWGGDTYVYYGNAQSDQFVLAWQSLWETNKDTDEFWQASLEYAAKRWGSALSTSDTSTSWQTSNAGLVTLRRAGKQVLWLMTPSVDIQSKILAKLGTFGE